MSFVLRDKGSGRMRFEGQTAIVTGAARGIGEAIARRLASEGAAVMIATSTMYPPRLPLRRSASSRSPSGSM